MQERINFLEKRNRELEEYNSFLTGMFNEMKGNPQFIEMMKGAAEKINKVIRND